MQTETLVRSISDRFISKRRLGQNKREQARTGMMNMKQTVFADDFVRAFDDYGRGDNFSRAGRFALYEYLTEMEHDSGIEWELDVIALCCEFSEYENLEEFREIYRTDYETLEDVQDQTLVIAGYDGTKFIAQNY